VLSASLSRAMAAQGRRVLLVDTRPCGLLPLLLATPDLAPGTLQTVSCGTAAAPLAVLTGDNTPGAGDDSLALQLHRAAKGMQQVLMDVATASATLLRQLLPLATHVLVILTPDLASLSSLQALRTLVDPLLDRGDTRVDLHYLINQFEPAERLHVAIREMLQAELGERLLPFALHRSTELQEAMAEGLPVAQVTPEAAIVEDLHHLAQWVSALDDSQTGELLTRRWRQR
jgi:cellulose biosynthesis protein BcsQ